ncbi:MAG: pyridoxal-phosphate dependent enzyme [Candidatus Marithrix sp.]|nr:pyridoxal-phosphate dependent enzyme [Candidatus Marithrix sp.]
MQTQICNSIIETIGNTPIVSLRHPLLPNGKTLYLKLEQFNPTFSIKDRTALGLIQAAFKSGTLKRGGTVIESTSGNLGKSLAMLGAAMDFNVIIVVDPKVTTTNLNLYKVYGAQVEMVTTPDKQGGYQQARIYRVKELLKLHVGAYWPNQYDNPDNPTFHQNNTALEISHLDFDLLVGAVSTGGHLTGIARWFKANRPTTQVLACDVEGSAIFGTPFKPYLVNGVGLSWRADNTDFSVFDHCYHISDQEAISLCHIIARERAILMGGSGGLVVYGALTYLHATNVKSALALIPDTGINYLEQIYDEDWLSSKNIKLLTTHALLKKIHIGATKFNPK